MQQNIIIDFLLELKENNHKEWFHANKSRYDEVKKQVEVFSSLLIQEIRQFDTSISSYLTPKDTLFRINKDIRFSKDKTPYKTYIGIFISKNPKGFEASYYLHLEPNNCFLAGGIYKPPTSVLRAIRNEIYYSGNGFNNLISTDVFKQLFGEIDGEKLVNIPKDFPSDYPYGELLKYKSYTCIHHFEDKLITSSDFMPYAIEKFKVVHPFNDFLNQALAMEEETTPL